MLALDAKLNGKVEHQLSTLFIETHIEHNMSPTETEHKNPIKEKIRE
jgi:hypothetical protein